MYLHRPPSLSSALAPALSWSFLIKHWYIPLSSFFTDSILRNSKKLKMNFRSSTPMFEIETFTYLRVASWCFMSFPSLSHVIVLTGFPSYLQVNTAGLPKSTVCVAGSTVAFRGAVTVKTVSTDSPKIETRYISKSDWNLNAMFFINIILTTNRIVYNA